MKCQRRAPTAMHTSAGHCESGKMQLVSALASSAVWFCSPVCTSASPPRKAPRPAACACAPGNAAHSKLCGDENRATVFRLKSRGGMAPSARGGACWAATWADSGCDPGRRGSWLRPAPGAVPSVRCELATKLVPRMRCMNSGRSWWGGGVLRA
jgi:hypothetical protein